MSRLVFLSLLLSMATHADSYLIMLPAPQTSVFEGHWLRVAHRFNGELSSDAAKDAFGLDYGAQVRLQWDWLRQPGQQFSVSRSSPSGRIEAGMRQTWWQQEALSVYSWHSVMRQYSNAKMSPTNSHNHALLFGQQCSLWRGLLGLGYAAQTNPGHDQEPQGTISLLSGFSFNIYRQHGFQVEVIQPLIGYQGDNHHPAISLGWYYDAFLHQFRIHISNSRQLDSHWLITTEGIQDSRKMHGGFVISRRF